MPPLTHHRTTLRLKVARPWVGLVRGATHGSCELRPPTDRISFCVYCFTLQKCLWGQAAVIGSKTLDYMPWEYWVGCRGFCAVSEMGFLNAKYAAQKGRR